MSKTWNDILCELTEQREPYAIATVIQVNGSASARPGSKAIINSQGINLLGWVGGGCAENFVCQNAIEAIEEQKPRTITADLDDEIFGLGMPCGGSMEIFVDPHLPPVKLFIDHNQYHQQTISALTHLLEGLGFELTSQQSDDTLIGPQFGDSSSFEDILLTLSQFLIDYKKTTGLSLRKKKGIAPETPLPKTKPLAASELHIFGHSRISESLANLAFACGWKVSVHASHTRAENYPRGVHLSTQSEFYSHVRLNPQDMVIVASHHKGDPEIIEKAIQAKCSYIGLIASQKRSKLVLSRLLEEKRITPQALPVLFAPAGIDLGSPTPLTIALSVLTEIIHLKKEKPHHISSQPFTRERGSSQEVDHVL